MTIDIEKILRVWKAGIVSMNYIQYCEILFGTKVLQKVEVNISEMYTYDVISKAHDIMKHYEKMFSFYDAESDIGRINSNTTENFVKVSDETFEIIKKAFYYGMITKGMFDVTIAPVVKEWNENSVNPIMPDHEKLLELALFVDFKNIEINYEEKSIRLKNPNMKIDLWGIAKGYVVDKVIEHYKKYNINSAMLNIDGNIKVLGKKNNTNLWNVAIYESESENLEIACVVCVDSEQSVVTSGNYKKGMKNNCLLNPTNGQYIENDIKSVTIINESSVECDGLSTAISVMGKIEGIKFMKEHNIDGFIITNENEIIVSRSVIEKLRVVQDYKVLCF